MENEEDENVVDDNIDDVEAVDDTRNTTTSAHSSGLALALVPTNKKWTCGECEKICNSWHALFYHKKTHSNIRPFSCVQCGKTFVHKHHLALHEKIHTGVKGYECLTCQKSFVQKIQLTRHEKIHTGMKEHGCGTCG